MPKRPCAQPGCAELVAKGYCTAHVKAVSLYDERRGSAASRGYDAAWVRVKNQVLKRDGYQCQPCKRKKLVVRAAEVDHIVALEDGGARLDPNNCEAKCHSCHVQKTWKERRARAGGAINPPSRRRA